MGRIKIGIVVATVSLIVGVMLAGGKSSAQDEKKQKTEYIQAQAMGTAQQLGQTFAVTLMINEYSTAADQKILLDAFAEKGNEGMVNALSKMSSKGRMSITGTLGYEVNYIRQFPMPDGGRKIRLVTNRPITFGEAWTSSRSMDYSLSGMEIILAADKKKNSGRLAPACQFKMDKENELTLELLRNEFNLVNVQVR